MNMSSTATHPAFPQPPDISTLAWRYMDLPKLLSLIVNRELYLEQLDLMPDEYEGLYPAQVSAMLAAQGVPAAKAKETADSCVAFARESRKKLFVSCWHLSHIEFGSNVAHILRRWRRCGHRLTLCDAERLD